MAVSDPHGRVATPLCVLPSEDVLMGARSWQRVLEDWEPDMLLAGLPRTLAGNEGAQARRIRAAAERIAQAAQLPLELSDERLSSAEAKRSLGELGLTEKDQRGKVDMIAASLFLQAWLDARAADDGNATPAKEE